jgi:peptide/nickel transport system permease protein
VPELATAWETPDPLTYVFTLQRGVKFHDGTDFDASIVK